MVREKQTALRNIGPFPIHSPSASFQLHLAKHTPPNSLGHWHPSTTAKMARHGGRASKPSRDSGPGMLDSMQPPLKLALALCDAHFPLRRGTASPFLACSATNQQSQDHPHRHHWLFVSYCPSSGNIPKLRILTHSMPRTTGFVWSPGLSTWLLASPSLTHAQLFSACATRRGELHRSRHSTTAGADWMMPPRRLPVDHGVSHTSPFPTAARRQPPSARRCHCPPNFACRSCLQHQRRRRNKNRDRQKPVT